MGVSVTGDIATVGVSVTMLTAAVDQRVALDEGTLTLSLTLAAALGELHARLGDGGEMVRRWCGDGAEMVRRWWGG